MAPPRRARRRPARRPSVSRRSTATTVVAAAIAVALVLALVLSLVAVGGGSGGSGDDDFDAGAPLDPTFDPAVEFRLRCAGCHGADGSGGTGPRLNGGVLLQKYPDAADQFEVVKHGRNAMPAFGERGMTDAEIRAVVEYTREQLSLS
jgi:mono/diheme cytochrome c family protein